MWFVYRRSVKEMDRMFFCGKPGEWTTIPQAAACYHDRRDASRIASWLLADYPGPVDKNYVFGEEFIVLRPADPKQLAPK